MFNGIFGKNEGMYVMTVFWDYDVDINDLMTDLEVVGQLMCRPAAIKKGCRIDTVRDWKINDTNYRTAELYVDKNTEKIIRELTTEKKFVAVKFTETCMTKS